MGRNIKGSKIRNKVDCNKNVSIKNSMTRKKSDRELEKEAIEEENISIIAIIIIVVLCFVIGILLGWGLYKVAINNSNIAFVINGMFF